MYCRKCRYNLRGLTSNRCPECGRAFDPNDPRTFYRPCHYGRSVRRFLIVGGSLFLSVILLQMLFVPSGLDRMSVCTKCGRKRHATEYYAPIVGSTYYTKTEEQGTQLSKMFERHFPGRTHQHNWVFVSGRFFGLGGGGCALGTGHELSGVVNDPQVAGFLEGLITAGDNAAFVQWHDRLLDRKATFAAQQSVRRTYPASGFANQTLFDDWWSKKGPEIEAGFTHVVATH